MTSNVVFSLIDTIMITYRALVELTLSTSHVDRPTVDHLSLCWWESNGVTSWMADHDKPVPEPNWGASYLYR